VFIDMGLFNRSILSAALGGYAEGQGRKSWSIDWVVRWEVLFGKGNWKSR